jgi:hypothetical protein
MRKPRDIRADDYRDLLSLAPAGAKLIKTKSRGSIRDFVFELNARSKNHKFGSTLVMSAFKMMKA